MSKRRKPKSTFSQYEAARRLGISKISVRRAIDAGELAVDLKRHVPLAALDAFLAQPPEWLQAAREACRDAARVRAAGRAAAHEQRLRRLRALPSNQQVDVSMVAALLRGRAGVSYLPELGENETGLEGRMSAGYALMLFELTQREQSALAHLVAEQRAAGTRPPVPMWAPLAASVSAQQLDAMSHGELRTLKHDITGRLARISSITEHAFNRYCTQTYGAGCGAAEMTVPQLRAAIIELAGWLDELRVVGSRQQREVMSFYLLKDIAAVI